MLASACVLALALAGGRFEERTLTVFAAASLKEAFSVIGNQFEGTARGVKVRFQFAGSQQLAAQIKLGALADVFASAAQQNLDQVAHDRASRTVFARNRLVIVIPKARSPVTNLSSLDRARRLVLAAPAVPAGRYSLEMLDRAGKQYGAAWRARVQSRVVSQELDVRSVLAKVVVGEADAGIVYASDAQTARGRVRAIAVPAALSPAVEYPAAVVSRSREKGLAGAFVRFLTTPSAQAVLARYGFLKVNQPSLKRG
jgi:molybdate transport system substrate-binding protein